MQALCCIKKESAKIAIDLATKMWKCFDNNNNKKIW